MVLKDLSENGHDYTDQINSILYDYSSNYEIIDLVFTSYIFISFF